jgi:hypothetical protein
MIALQIIQDFRRAGSKQEACICTIQELRDSTLQVPSDLLSMRQDLRNDLTNCALRTTCFTENKDDEF